MSKEKSFYNYKLKKIVIDAGHGGKDSGCSGKYVKEKDITLAIALKLGSYITKNLKDVEVIYTRKKNVFVELHERAALANRKSADLFISIHCNSASKHTTVSGTETYIMGLDKSQENLDVARRENAVVQLENNYQANYDGFDIHNPESEIIFSLYQNAYLNQSIRFASLVENQFKYRARRSSRGVKQESFLVLYKTAMPSVLIETGFLTNKKEEGYLRSDDGQSYIASAIYRAFKEYKYASEGTLSNKANQGWSLDVSPQRSEFLHYKIQLYDAYQSVDLGSPDFSIVTKIDIETNEDGIKRYMLEQSFNDYNKAMVYLEDLKTAGFKHAQIVLYDGEDRIAE